MPTVKLPLVGKNGESATVRRWQKRDGEWVAQGDILLEVETEAGVAEIESPAAGVLRQAVAEGKRIVPGTPLASVSDAGTEAKPAMSNPKPTSPTTNTASAGERRRARSFRGGDPHTDAAGRTIDGRGNAGQMACGGWGGDQER